jgi:hypothetical protein
VWQLVSGRVNKDMNKRDEVYKYVSDTLEIPPDRLIDEMDIVSEVDWEKRHEDERLDLFLEDFVGHFKINIPRQNFYFFAKQKGIPKLLYPLAYPMFIFRWREQLEVKHLTIKEMIEVVDSGVWEL